MPANYEKPTSEPSLPPVILPTAAELLRSRANAAVIRELVPLVARAARGQFDRSAETEEHLVLWASQAGLLSHSREGLIATRKGTLFDADPISAFDDIVDVVRDTGTLTLRARTMGRGPHEVERLLDQKTVALLAVLCAAGGPVPVQELARIATDPADAGITVDSTREWDFHHVLPYVGLMMDGLAFAGLIEWKERRTTPRLRSPEPVSTRRGAG
jgi:hypothetical protein